MTITYHGENYVKLQSGNTTILIDPLNQRSFKGANLIINTTRPGEVESSLDNYDAFWIDHQGEYEVGGIRIKGWQNEWEEGRESTIYIIDFEGFRFLILGQIKKEPKLEIQEFAKDIDVAIVPGGGSPFLSESSVAKFLRQIEPAFIVPTLWEDDIKGLLKELNKDDCKTEEKLVIQKKDVKQGTMELRCLKE